MLSVECCLFNMRCEYSTLNTQFSIFNIHYMALSKGEGSKSYLPTSGHFLPQSLILLGE